MVSKETFVIARMGFLHAMFDSAQTIVKAQSLAMQEMFVLKHVMNDWQMLFNIDSRSFCCYDNKQNIY